MALERPAVPASSPRGPARIFALVKACARRNDRGAAGEVADPRRPATPSKRHRPGGERPDAAPGGRALAVVAAGDLLMKLKPHLDAEAVVIAVRPGAGKYRGAVGALEVETADGRRFAVGSGLDDALRRDPPPPGSVITYRYRELTSNGLPRFATYLRRHQPL